MTNDSIRDAFEDWYSCGDKKSKAIERDGEKYILMHACIAWAAWKAALSSAANHVKYYLRMERE